MNYPKWLYTEIQYAWEADVLSLRVVRFVRDAWALAYYAGAEGSMTTGEFCAKYADQEAPQTELVIGKDCPHGVPMRYALHCVDCMYPHPNDGARI